MSWRVRVANDGDVQDKKKKNTSSTLPGGKFTFKKNNYWLCSRSARVPQATNICVWAIGKTYLSRCLSRFKTSLRSKRSCALIFSEMKIPGSASKRVLAARKMGRAQKMKRGGGGEERREHLHPTIVNLKYSVRQPTEPLIGSKLDR